VSGKRVLILGYGSSGKAAEALARSLGFSVTVWDKEAGEIIDFEFAVVSPGIALDSPLIEKCRGLGVPLKSELQFGCEELKRRGWKLLAVTGSKGKSSVVKLCAEALGGVACGNFGRPVCDVALEANPRWAVVEVSSFMMETTTLPADVFAAAAILNLQEDHLDRHGSVEVYHALKRKLLNFAAVKIEGTDGSADPSLWRGSYFDNPVLTDNAECAARLMRAAGLADEAIRAVFAAFRPLPHRFELVAELDGVKYVDDSKATSIAALAAGVAMCDGKVRLIAGGLEKGDDPKIALSVLTNRAKKVYLIGHSAEKFFFAWSDAVNCEVCGTLERAVESVKREAVKGETVLLSPGTASFDQFKSFGERGEKFAFFVKQGKQ